ncbi:MAG: response regulator [Candidatus Micrarchaeota archaeon]
MEFRKKGNAPDLQKPHSLKPLAEGLTTAPPASAVRAKGKVLVAEDEALVMSVAKRIFSLVGDGVLPAETGRRALEVFRENPDISLIVLDFHLPDMRCGDLISEIRSSGRDVRIIVYSGNLPGSMPEGADALLSKPFTTVQVLEAVNAAFLAGR